MKRNLLAIALSLLALPSQFAGSESPEPAVRIRVLSPRMGAEVPFGQEKIGIVVEVEDATEEGIKVKKGIPQFEMPTFVDGKTNDDVKANMDLFQKSIVSATSYRIAGKSRHQPTRVYQLIAVVKITLLGGGCKVAVAPENIPPGVSEVPAAGYKSGAEFEFRIADSPRKSKPEETYGPNLCIVVDTVPEN